MKHFYALFVFIVASSLHAQDPAIAWQQTIGGSGSDVLNSLELTPDGGYIIGGYTPSNASGDKTENSNGALDLWIVKTDASGNIQWQNTIGGAGDDFVNVVKPTADGGYIVFAGSDSNMSGDKSENSRGGLDYWILKLDSSGAIVWQHTYGGANPDFDTFGQQTADGGYIVAGYSDSGATGDKTEASNGQRDYWILKLDALGNIVWQNAIGGSLVDRVQAAAQTPDGGYIIGGFSFSPASGDKTENAQGGSDYWIVKLNASGAIQWQNTIGGAGSDAFRDLVLTADGGYLVGGYSNSQLTGDKTENSNGDYDYWVVKLDATGNIQWQNTIGGAGTDYLRDLKQLADGSYIISGYSNSNISGDKAEASNGGYDYWLVKLNASGAITAQNSIGGAADESGPYLIPTADSGFIMGCSSASSISGDKSENSEGSEDYWIFKVSDAILATADVNEKQAVTVWPNPTDGLVNLAFNAENNSGPVLVYDILGKSIPVTKRTENTTLSLDLSCLAPGVYFIALGASHEKIKVVKK